jgi:transcriptional regulator with XRE-family HTH domain
MMSTSEKIPANILRLRKKMKLSQEEFAAKIGISVSFASMLERGKRLPSYDVLDSIAAAGGTTPAKLLS